MFDLTRKAKAIVRILLGEVSAYAPPHLRKLAADALDDRDLGRWGRWAVALSAKTYADFSKRNVADIISMHGVISLASLLHDSGSVKGTFEVIGASWPAMPDATGGDWRVTIERIDIREDI